MEDNEQGRTHYEVPVNITDREIEVIEGVIRVLKKTYSWTLEDEIKILQGLLDKINNNDNN